MDNQSNLQSNNKISFYTNFCNNNIKLSINDIKNMVNLENINNTSANINTNIKDLLAEKINELGIKCSSRNIKLFDMQNNFEIKTAKDLLENNTKQCKIIIVPVELHHS